MKVKHLLYFGEKKKKDILNTSNSKSLPISNRNVFNIKTLLTLSFMLVYDNKYINKLGETGRLRMHVKMYVYIY